MTWQRQLFIEFYDGRYRFWWEQDLFINEPAPDLPEDCPFLH